MKIYEHKSFSDSHKLSKRVTSTKGKQSYAYEYLTALYKPFT